MMHHESGIFNTASRRLIANSMVGLGWMRSWLLVVSAGQHFWNEREFLPCSTFIGFAKALEITNTCRFYLIACTYRFTCRTSLQTFGYGLLHVRCLRPCRSEYLKKFLTQVGNQEFADDAVDILSFQCVNINWGLFCYDSFSQIPLWWISRLNVHIRHARRHVPKRTILAILEICVEFHRCLHPQKSASCRSGRLITYI